MVRLKTRDTFLPRCGVFSKYMLTLALSFHLWRVLFYCRALSKMNIKHPNGLKCLALILTCGLENIRTGVLLTESYGL